MKTYTCAEIEKLVNYYVDKGGEVNTIQEGCLGYGITVLSGLGLKYAIIKEKYLNEWSSVHTIRMYRKCPKKY